MAPVYEGGDSSIERSSCLEGLELGDCKTIRLIGIEMSVTCLNEFYINYCSVLSKCF